MRLEACDAGYGRACWEASFEFEPGRGERLALQEFACRSGYGLGCFAAGVSRGQREIETGNFGGAARSFRQGCELDDGNSCYGLAQLVRIGATSSPGRGPWERQRAMACKLGAKGACAWPDGPSPLAAIALDDAPNPPRWASLGIPLPEDGLTTVTAAICAQLNGKVERIELLTSSGNAEFDELVRDSLGDWTFRPLSDSSEPMGCVGVRFEFVGSDGLPFRKQGTAVDW